MCQLGNTSYRASVAVYRVMRFPLKLMDELDRELASTEPANFKKTASMNDFATLMPEAEAQPSFPTVLHRHKNGLQEILFTRKDEDGWTETVARCA